MPYLTVADTEVYFEQVGQGEPVLLLHGLGSSRRDWEHQIAHLRAHYRVIAVDLPGHGRSPPASGPVSIAGFARVCAGLLEQLSLPPVHLVGISMGAAVGFQLAVDSPERVRSLVAINGVPEFVVRGLRQRLMLAQRLLMIRCLSMARIGRVLAGRLFPGEELADTRATFVRRWAENDKTAYLRSLKALIGWSVSDRLDALRAPVLLLASEFDYTSVAYKEGFLPRLPRAELSVIPGAHHAVSAERPAEVNARLDDWLSRWRAGGD